MLIDYVIIYICEHLLFITFILYYTALKIYIYCTIILNVVRFTLNVFFLIQASQKKLL